MDLTHETTNGSETMTTTTTRSDGIEALIDAIRDIAGEPDSDIIAEHMEYALRRAGYELRLIPETRTRRDAWQEAAARAAADTHTTED